MTLTGISAVRIPEGGVKSISVGGRTIWQKPVTERYTELAYIESTGTQYIDTGIAAKTDIEVHLDHEFATITSTSSILFGAVRESTRLYTAHSKGIIGYGLNYSIDFKPKINTAYSLHAILRAGMQSVVVNNDNVYRKDEVNGIDTGLTAYLFAINKDGGAANYGNARIYACQIIADGVLVRDFVPCRRNSDGEVGMYDRVSKEFFGNLGTGELIAGETGGAV